jgi:hypothetical protein
MCQIKWIKTLFIIIQVCMIPISFNQIYSRLEAKSNVPLLFSRIDTSWFACCTMPISPPFESWKLNGYNWRPESFRTLIYCNYTTINEESNCLCRKEYILLCVNPQADFPLPTSVIQKFETYGTEVIIPDLL